MADIAFETAQRMLLGQSREEAIRNAEAQAQGPSDVFWTRVREYLQVLPMPQSSSRRLNGLSAVKRCSTCGKGVSPAEWEALELVGYQVIPPWQDDPGAVLELRNHSCRSTLSKTLPYTALQFEAEVERQRAVTGKPLKEVQAIVAERLRAPV